MDTRTGNFVTEKEMKRLIESGQRKPGDFIPITKLDPGKPIPKGLTAFQPDLKTIEPGQRLSREITVGCTLEFDENTKARITQIGTHFITAQMIGPKGLTKESVGACLELGDQTWRIITAGKIFRLKRRIGLARCKSCQKVIFQDEPRFFKNEDGSHTCGGCVNEMILGKLKSENGLQVINNGFNEALDQAKKKVKEFGKKAKSKGKK